MPHNSRAILLSFSANPRYMCAPSKMHTGISMSIRIHMASPSQGPDQIPESQKVRQNIVSSSAL